MAVSYTHLSRTRSAAKYAPARKNTSVQAKFTANCTHQSLSARLDVYKRQADSRSRNGSRPGWSRRRRRRSRSLSLIHILRVAGSIRMASRVFIKLRPSAPAFSQARAMETM